DATAADAHGEGLQGFGGTWHVVKTDAAVTPGSGAGSGSSGSGSTSETTTTASSTY
ncbi:MAG: hypothetical protein JO291_13160, partial [Acidimicrobiia bacterium]|nr:hypothetical protein [Acidimicrobiia bacterium]